MKLAIAAPRIYIGSVEESMAKTLNLGFLLLFITLPIILLQQVLKEEYLSASLVGFGLLSSIIIRLVFLKGYLRLSVYLFVLSFSLIVTGICTFGNGINDITIISYPILIGFSSVLLRRRELFITTVFSIAGVCWLVFGDILGYYDPIPVVDSQLTNFIVTSSVVILGGYVAHTLTFNMKHSLEKAQKQTQKTKKDSEILTKELESKEKIIYEINRKVIDSLKFIRGYIDLQINSIKKNKSAYQDLNMKILVVEAIHEQLIETTNYNVIKVKSLIRELVRKYVSLKTLSNGSIDLSYGRRFIATLNIDESIAMGVCIISLMNISSQENIRIRCEQASDQLSISFTATYDDTYSGNQILQLLLKQLKAQIVKSDGAIKLIIPLKSAES